MMDGNGYQTMTRHPGKARIPTLTPSSLRQRARRLRLQLFLEKGEDKVETFRRFLVRYGERFGKIAWMFYALVFLLVMAGVLGAVYLVFGWLMYKSPNAVLILTGVLVALIFYFQFRRKR